MENYLSIFTTTYNRGYILQNLYRSLCNQTCKNFEWIIFDDGSSDNTVELMNNIISSEHSFDIIFKTISHGGKHRAINKGVDIASGNYFFIVDSDDQLTDNAVELIYKWLSEISNSNVVGVAGLKMNTRGQVCGGTPLISDCYITATNLERKKFNLLGDKAEVYLTQSIKDNKFPEFDNEYFVTEDVCWNAIASKGGAINWYNVPIYICEYLNDGLTMLGANSIEGHLNSFKGYCYYVKQYLMLYCIKDSVFVFFEYEKTCNMRRDSLKKRAAYLELSIPQYCFLWLRVRMYYYPRRCFEILNHA